MHSWICSAAASVAALLTAGCGWLIGTDEFEPRPTTRDAGPPVGAEAGPTAPTHFLGGADCTRCLDRECSGPVTDCAEERVVPDCSEQIGCSEEPLSCQVMLDCRRACTDPLCIRGCIAPLTRTRASAPALDALSACASTRCAKECRPGGDWSCTGEYSAPAAFIDAVDITVRVADWPDALPLSGVQVAACRPELLTCDAPLAQQTTGATGEVTLQGLPSRNGRGFAGRYRFSDVETGDGGGVLPARFLTTTAVATLPVRPSDAEFFILPPASAWTSYLEAVGRPFDAAHGYVIVEVRDCSSSWGGSGIRLELDPADPGVELWYWSEGLPSTTSSATDSSGRVSIAHVPAGTGLNITGIDTATGRVVGFARVYPEAGEMTSVFMYPLTIDQAAALE